MTTIDKLIELAETALTPDHNESDVWYSAEDLVIGSGVGYFKNARFIAAANPATVKQLCLLLKQCKDVLSDERYVTRYTQVEEAIAAIEAFAAIEGFDK